MGNLGDRVSKLYNNAVDGFMVWRGFFPEDGVTNTFGGLPRQGTPDFLGSPIRCPLNGKSYAYLGPFKAPYYKIREAAQRLMAILMMWL